MKIVLLDYGSLGPAIDLSPVEQAGKLAAYEMTAPEQLTERICDADVVITNKMKLNRHTLNGAARLKLICVTATGFDNIDLPYCKERNIAVCNVPGYSTDSVAQLTLAAALALSTHLVAYRGHVHSGFYSRSGSPNLLTPVWHELAGKTWGIVGCGNIGRKVAAVAAVLGCRVLVYRRKPDPDYETVDLDTLLRQSDVVSVHLPLNEETRGILSRKKIALMKKDAIFVNVARGAVADEAALAEAIEAGSLGGLAVDVFSAEPLPEDHPYHRIMDRENVIFTPHCAWGAQEARNRCVREVAENINAFKRGEKRNRVDA
ncbi:MAG: hydroxyacid dehydrogenase [Oscillospiraceae bacterium]|nr:hydroxyacid dehydrogenase [Oscillospiraceae bacterium]